MAHLAWMNFASFVCNVCCVVVLQGCHQLGVSSPEVCEVLHGQQAAGLRPLAELGQNAAHNALQTREQVGHSRDLALYLVPEVGYPPLRPLLLLLLQLFGLYSTERNY